MDISGYALYITISVYTQHSYICFNIIYLYPIRSSNYKLGWNTYQYLLIKIIQNIFYFNRKKVDKKINFKRKSLCQFADLNFYYLLYLKISSKVTKKYFHILFLTYKFFVVYLVFKRLTKFN